MTISATIEPGLFVTTAAKPSGALIERAREVAGELGVEYTRRINGGFDALFESLPECRRLLVVQTERFLLVDRSGETFFPHPNIAFLRLGNIRRGNRDLLIDAAGLSPGDRVLDCTLGYGSEAILCAHAVGPTGEVHGIEAIVELGYVVRDGLSRVTTSQRILNDAMRRVEVVHLGSHLDFLRDCPTGRYDVVCFDPFFDLDVDPMEQLSTLRHFGERSALARESIEQARRVACRRVLVKTARFSPLAKELSPDEVVTSRHGRVGYLVFEARNGGMSESESEEEPVG